ncbi:37S ribosomal protein S22, partial [Lobosporangium transversale]
DSKYTYVVLRKGTRPVYMPLVQTLIPSDAPSTQSSNSHNTNDAPISEIVKPSGGIEQKVAEINAGKKKKVKKQLPPPPVPYGNAEDMQAASHSWPQIVIPPLKRDGHVVMDTCAASGFLERIIPKSQGKIPYRDARKAMWGDLLLHGPKNRPMRKDIVENVSDGQDSGSGAKSVGDIEGKKLKQRRGPLNTGNPGMLERMKHKEKKQSRQKVTLEADGSASSRKNRRRKEEDDVILEL